MMFRSNIVQILGTLGQYTEFSGSLNSVANNTGKADRSYELLRFKSLFGLAATSPTCVAKVTNILVLAKHILLYATGC